MADADARILALYEADRREHAAVPAVATAEYRALRERDRDRRLEAETVLSRLRLAGSASAIDLYHVAWLLNHGELPVEARRAHQLARQAADRGYRPARWLAAAAYDRWCMYEGRPQKYGTQFVPDGTQYRLWDLEPATTDVERAAWDVPPLQDQLRRAEAMTRTEPQPPMDQAPEWLKAAIERWRPTANGQWKGTGPTTTAAAAERE